MSCHGRLIMTTSASYLKICVLAVVTVMLSCIGVTSAMTLPSHTGNPPVSSIPDRGWQKLIGGERVSQRQVAWRIRITDVSSFGGFYVKGHLLDTKTARVHLVWPPDAAPSGSTRARLIHGGVVTVLGEFEGVTSEHEAIVSVRECLP